MITAAEAQVIIAAEQRKLNNGRRLPVTLDRIRVLAMEEAFPICNVGPWTHRCERACLSVVIPGYDPTKDAEGLGYAKSALQDSIRREAEIIDENRFGWFEDDGHFVARDLIGIGHNMHPHNSLVQYGVFVPEGKRPTPAEVDEARRQLSLYRDRLIVEARDAYDKGPKEREAVIGERHLWAARSLGIDEKWVHHQHTQEAVRCEMCGKYNPAGVAKCQCGSIIDIELYKKITARQEEMLTAPEQPAPRGANAIIRK